MALPLGRLPRYLVLEPVSSVRLELRLPKTSCEIDVDLENPRPGRAFLLLLGPPGGPLVQRMRLSGRAAILFEPSDERAQLLVLANPQKEPLVLRLHGRVVRRRRSPARDPRPWSGPRTPTEAPDAAPYRSRGGRPPLREEDGRRPTGRTRRRPPSAGSSEGLKGNDAPPPGGERTT